VVLILPKRAHSRLALHVIFNRGGLYPLFRICAAEPLDMGFKDEPMRTAKRLKTQFLHIISTNKHSQLS
jgi:hypothetical protein